MKLRISTIVAPFVLIALFVVGFSEIYSTLNKVAGSSQVAGITIDTDDVGGAVGNPGGDTGGGVSNPGGGSSGGGASPGGLTNPIQSESITELLTAILDILLTLAIPILVLMVMYAGFLYVTAQGDETKVKKAHSALTWAVVGGVIVLAAKLIIDLIEATVAAI
jgi:uncharacterized membrane protein YjfL (UPF0719 family)